MVPEKLPFTTIPSGSLSVLCTVYTNVRVDVPAPLTYVALCGVVPTVIGMVGVLAPVPTVTLSLKVAVKVSCCPSPYAPVLG